MDFEGRRWDTLLDGWLQLIPASGRFRHVHGLSLRLKT